MDNEMMKERIRGAWEMSLEAGRYPALCVRLAAACVVMATVWLWWLARDTALYLARATAWAWMLARAALPAAWAMAARWGRTLCGCMASLAVLACVGALAICRLATSVASGAARRARARILAWVPMAARLRTSWEQAWEFRAAVLGTE